MQLVQNIKQKSMPRTVILFAPITIGTVVATDALAAGRGGGGEHIGAAFGGGHTGGGFVSAARLAITWKDPEATFTAPAWATAYMTTSPLPRTLRCRPVQLRPWRLRL